jgi:hypothetical protein
MIDSQGIPDSIGVEICGLGDWYLFRRFTEEGATCPSNPEFAIELITRVTKKLQDRQDAMTPDMQLVRKLSRRIAMDFDFNGDEINSIEEAICEVLRVKRHDRREEPSVGDE